jgi:Tfp pilus assembly protein PilF
MTLPAEAVPPNRDRLWFVLGAAALVVGIFLAYLPAIHGGPVWDDDYMLTGNPAMTEAHGLWRIWFDLTAVQVYYPLTLSAMWVECRAFGLHDLTGYHVVNTLLHGIDAVLLWRLLRRLEVPGAFVAAAIWGLHPLNVESVGWITEQKNTLSGLLYLTSIGALLRFYRVITPATRRGQWYVAALVLFALALAAKTTAVTLPAAALLVVWWKRGRIRGGDLWAAVPFIAVAAVAGQITQWVETHVTGTWRDEWSLTRPQQVLVAGRALWFYAGKLAWPVGLSFAYPRWHVDPAVAWQWIFPVTAIGVVGTLWTLRDRIGRGPVVGVLFFAGTLAPALGFFRVLYQRFTFVSDHFQYLAGIGLIAVATAAVARLGIPKPVKIALAAVVCLSLGAGTASSARRFASDTAVWKAALAIDPDNPSANLNYASDLVQQGKLDDAMPPLQRLWATGQMRGRVLANLGTIAEYRADTDPSQWGVALKYYGQSVDLEPDEPRAHYKYGTTLLVLGRYTEAADQLRTTIALKPDWAEAHDNLGVCLLHLHRPADAAAEFQRAGEIDPGLPHLPKHLAEAAAAIR